MLVLYITPPILTEGWTHEGTDWQVAEDPDFQNIVKESLNDQTNKLVKIFDDSDLDPDKTYYSRARVIFNKGLAEWADVQIVKLKDVNTIDVTLDLPTIVAIPEVELNFNPNNVPRTFFTINTSAMSCNTNAKHIATTYVIEDINGNVVYSDLFNSEDLTKKFITTNKLEEGKVYTLTVLHHASTGDTSEPTKFMFKTSEVDVIKLLVDTENIDVETNDGYVIKLDNIDDFSKLYVKFYSVRFDEVNLLADREYEVLSFKLEKELFTNPDKKYILELQVEYDNGEKTESKFIPVTTT